MRKYDTTFIIDGTLQEAAREALIERFAGILKKLGGEIDQIVRWGQRQMAYTMKKRTHGYYVIFYYHAEPSIISAFERDLRLHENILRYMTMLNEGKHPDYIRDESVIGEASASTAVKKDEETVTEEPVLSEEEEAIEEYPDDDIDSDLTADEGDEQAQDKEKE